MKKTKDSHIKLNGQRVIVTGASSGIGSGIATGFGKAGADVVINYLNKRDSAEKLAKKIREYGVRAFAHQADVSQEDEVKAMFERTVDEWGSVDVLVNNAGIQKDASFVDMTLEEWDLVLSVNLTGSFLCAREAAREFKRRGPTDLSEALGKIIFISSVHENIPWAGHANYAATKGGIMLLMLAVFSSLFWASCLLTTPESNPPLMPL